MSCDEVKVTIMHPETFIVHQTVVDAVKALWPTQDHRSIAVRLVASCTDVELPTARHICERIMEASNG